MLRMTELGMVCRRLFNTVGSVGSPPDAIIAIGANVVSSVY